MSSGTYFAIFYVVGILLLALFVRFFLWKKRIKKEEQKLRERGRLKEKKGDL